MVWISIMNLSRRLRMAAVPGVKVGHHTLAERPTGCTAILVEGGATAGVDVRGAAPASAETDLLKPVNLVQQVFAVSLSGGSAFGLDARSGIIRYLDEKSVGFKAFGSINVPIVPAFARFHARPISLSSSRADLPTVTGRISH